MYILFLAWLARRPDLSREIDWFIAYRAGWEDRDKLAASDDAKGQVNNGKRN